MRPTSKDVAKAAGVSRATVSYVLNRTPGQTIPEATRQRVLEASARLGYTPHASARALRSGSSRLVLFVTQELPFGVNIARLVDRLTRGTAEQGLSLVTWQRSDTGSLASTLTHLQPLVVVAMFELSDSERALLGNSDIPLVDMTGPGAPLSHGRLTGQLQVERLALAGHRHLAAVTTANPVLSPFAAPRLEGIRRTCRQLGLPDPEVLELGGDPHAPSVNRIAEELRRWREGPDPVTGLCAYNDVYAAACLAAAAYAELDVPRDLSVIGVDDEPMARFTSPPLTTIRLQLDEVADAALEQVRQALSGPGRDSSGSSSGSSVGVELVARGSA